VELFHFLGMDSEFHPLPPLYGPPAPHEDSHKEEIMEGFSFTFRYLLDGCAKDLVRDVEERYHKPWDNEMLLNSYSWILSLCSHYFKFENEKRSKHTKKKLLLSSESLKPMDRVDMLLFLQEYLKETCACTQLMFW
ncbi:hypothetical protein IE077_003938, partial [Cardiosporidium cionae]